MKGKKRKKPMITLASLMLVTVLMIVAYLLYTNHKQKQEEALAAEEAAKEDTSVMINEEEPANFTSIQIDKDGQTTTWKRSKLAWVLDGEEAFPTDSEEVEELATLLTSLKAEKIVTEQAEDLTQFGLSDPRICVTATREDGTTLTLNIGDKLAVDTDYYGSISDNKAVYVLPLTTNTKFDVTKEDFIYIEETPSISKDQLLEIQLSTKDQGSFHIVYDKENPYDYSGIGSYPWYSIANNRLPINVDNTAITSLLENFINFSIAKGVDYGEEALKTYGLDQPQGMIYLRYLESTDSTQEKEFVLHLGNQDESGNYYVSVNDSDIVYLMLADSIKDKVAYQETDILTKFTHMVNIANVSELSIITQNTKHSFGYETKTTKEDDGNEKSETTFTVDGVENIDADGLRSFYQSVIGLKQNGILTTSDHVEGEPVLSLEFKLTSGKELKVEYYNYNSSSYAVVLNGNAQFTADKNIIDEFITGFETQSF